MWERAGLDSEGLSGLSSGVGSPSLLSSPGPHQARLSSPGPEPVCKEHVGDVRGVERGLRWGEAAEGGVRGGKTAEKLACVGREFSRPAGTEVWVGWRYTDHRPLLDTHTHPLVSVGAMQVGEGSQSQRVFAKIKGQ